MKEVVTGELSDWLSHCEVLFAHRTFHTAVCRAEEKRIINTLVDGRDLLGQLSLT